MNDRYDRSVRFFGAAGQDKLRRLHVAIVGVGGNGSHLAQQVALLGIGRATLVDDETIDETNLNRYVGATAAEVGAPKVDVAASLIRAIDPGITIETIRSSLLSPLSLQAIARADVVVGAVDNDTGRLVLNELTSAHEIPYIDVASDIVDESHYGGRVFVNWSGSGCLVCMALIDLDSAQEGLLSDAERRDLRKIYGVPRQNLGSVGPSVVTINGVIASLAATELMVGVTGIRQPIRYVTYHAHAGIVTRSVDVPADGCFSCKVLRGNPQESLLLHRLLRANRSRSA